MPTATLSTLNEAVLNEAIVGLTANPKTLSPWLFYDERGSLLFEQITTLPEYYLTRTERGILSAHAEEIITAAGDCLLTLVELGAGTATKTGLLLTAAAQRQTTVLYQPIDVSPSALDEACLLEKTISGLRVRPTIANYITEPLRLERAPGAAILALYIGSSIGNFSPEEARAILVNLRAQMRTGDSLLLGTDLAPDARKSVKTLLAAYDDAAGVTAAFNRNILVRLNEELGANFKPECFEHEAHWNAVASRMEMHLVSMTRQSVIIPTAEQGKQIVHFAAGETIHTENSYKFSAGMLTSLLEDAGFAKTRSWRDVEGLFAVTLAHLR